jgi:hypothetical protein
METVREAWTDERLDYLNAGMHREFDQVHVEIRDLRGEVHGIRDELRGEISDFRGHTDLRFDAMNARFDSLHRTLTVGCISIIATVVGAVVVNAN